MAIFGSIAPFASLPMYDWPEISPVWDRFWRAIRAALADQEIEANPQLRRSDDFEADWTDPDLLLGQTCGWPFVSRLGGKVVPFARFDFGLCRLPGDYHSVFLALSRRPAAEILRDKTAIVAVNGFESQSGFRAFSPLAVEPMELPAARILKTGGHRNSIRAVASGKAGLAAIDAQSWQLALKHEPAAREVIVVGNSPDVPGLPLITAPRFESRVPGLMAAINSGLDALAPEDRLALGIRGIVAASASDYRRLAEPPFGLVTAGA